MNDAAQFLATLRDDGHVRCTDARIEPLRGGVSSEIYLVHDGAEKFVVKRALAKLKVKDDWFADTVRNTTECNYLECVGRIRPGIVPRIHFAEPTKGYFAMEFFDDEFANWKQLLLSGVCRVEHAQLAGAILAEIHQRTTGDPELRKKFDTTTSFRQLRLAPYLHTTGDLHPELRDMFYREAARMEETREALVHGDFSPKNILIRGDRMVLLDCEVAWYGDPTFDVAFFLSHLLLKSLHHSPVDHEMESMVSGFWQSYSTARSEAGATTVEKRVGPLLLMLLLARVDGKSPVEYLSPRKQQLVRDIVGEQLRRPPQGLSVLRKAWFQMVTTSQELQANL
jgi:aminoglycoside phosphotransferase (APT) family kinase protein